VLVLFVQRCGVELLIVDEVEHITQPGLRRRLLELSNLTGVPIVCASCNPVAWTIGDAEIQGRWNDYFALTQLTGPRLDAFLSLLDLLLPFDADSHLGVRHLPGGPGQGAAPGPAQFVEERLCRPPGRSQRRHPRRGSGPQPLPRLDPAPPGGAAALGVSDRRWRPPSGAGPAGAR
jgi:hypothetical protein